MSDRETRWAVVVVDRFLNEQHLQYHRDSDYVAKVITNTQGRELTPDGRDYVFGNTMNEVEFFEVDNETQAKKLANEFNKLWESKRIRQNLHKLAKAL